MIASLLASALAMSPSARTIVRVPTRASIVSAYTETEDLERRMDEVSETQWVVGHVWWSGYSLS